MNSHLKKLLESASTVKDLSQQLIEEGIQSVSQTVNGIPFFCGLKAEDTELLEFDETHYLLVPILAHAPNYAVYTKRMIPPGHGPVNDLSKRRIFHLPHPQGKEIIERELIQNFSQKRLEECAPKTELADLLESLASDIDRETKKISGGLILIGGAIAFLNPIAGAGIAAKGLLPSIGTHAGKAGAEYLGEKLRSWKHSTAGGKLQRLAEKEVRTLKPEVYRNPILQNLDAIINNPEHREDPFLNPKLWADHFEDFRFYKVTREAIQEVYKGEVSSKDSENLSKTHREWIRSFFE